MHSTQQAFILQQLCLLLLHQHVLGVLVTVGLLHHTLIVVVVVGHHQVVGVGHAVDKG
jgi:hypothetical protein